jgi:hypothetical protein
MRCPDFVRQLSEANAGEGAWSAGWLVHSVGGDAVVAERDDIRFTAAAGSWCAANDQSVRAGELVSLRMPKEQLGISPGFYLAQSDAEFAAGRATPIVRVYWNVSSSGAVALMAQLTRGLNRLGVPFRFKVIGHPDRFSRCDAAVLYLAVDDFERAADTIADVYDAVRACMRPGVPAFTKRLRPGLGLAENPRDSDSFGWHRCGLVADAIVRAHEGRMQSLAERVDSVAKRFAEASLSLEVPYVNPKSTDRYALPSPRSAPTVIAAGASRQVPAPAAFDADDALAGALRIAENLTAAAYWHDGRCTWFGPEASSSWCDDPGRTRARRIVGSALYDGTSGIGLFLAEAARATGSDALRAAALGAARQSLARLPRDPALDNWGLYCGWPGVAFAIARIARLLAEPDLTARTRDLICNMLAHRTLAASEFDVISGGAGAVLALVSLAHLLDVPECLAAAETLGNGLCESSEPSPYGVSWCARSQRRGHNLTGYSHGTAGAAHALLELYAATARDRFAATAEKALSYERHWFSPAERNWPDFRGERHLPKRRAPEPFFQTAWCHGAPGIALSRLRAHALLNNRRYEEEAAAALDTTESAVERALAQGNAADSLCHGLTGNAEILSHSTQRLGSLGSRRREIIRRAARHLVAVTGERLGTLNAPNAATEPGLLLGAAGVGHFLLRLARPATASVLCVDVTATP